MEQSQLLCSFSDIQNYKNHIQEICSNYKILFNKIYILQNIENSEDVFLTYNIQCDCRIDFLNKTISLHRIKLQNVLYTINALNQLIVNDNNGILDKSFKIDWTKYQNSIIITNDDGLRIIKTKLLKIWNL